MPRTGRPPINPLDNVRLDPVTGCHEWLGRVDSHGYGQVKRGKKQAHRAMWELIHGPIPRGLVMHHLCENRRCVRASHLVVVTVRTNSRMRDSMWRDGQCGKGHTNIGVRSTNGQYYCRTCNAAYMRARRERSHV